MEYYAIDRYCKELSEVFIVLSGKVYAVGRCCKELSEVSIVLSGKMLRHRSLL